MKFTAEQEQPVRAFSRASVVVKVFNLQIPDYAQRGGILSGGRLFRGLL